MSKYIGATDAFNDILLKVDETFIQAAAYLKNLRSDAVGEKPGSKQDCPSSVQSERSCSPILTRVPLSPVRSRRSSKKRETYSVQVEDFVALDDKKKAVIMTSIEAKTAIPKAEVRKIEKLINDTLNSHKNPSSSTVFHIQM
ncbi:hypothetical protein GCK72_006125 [Caenorhabditis remanei]|uniref:Uncharacterized protein n=1 Tax=Caenorhabditis remanei TaxID=31234 RepID=A0A6A5HG04_CAERE|nr:hypothetical protein GCK72_006125 [Caenorhabditis remanei]KAF1766169.1 hypothetical protein GCK72_006125 [Caenorhabditis remanei]